MNLSRTNTGMVFFFFLFVQISLKAEEFPGVLIWFELYEKDSHPSHDLTVINVYFVYD